MKIELVRLTELTGKVWYLVRKGAITLKAFMEDDFDKANELYKMAIEKNGEPIEEIMLSHEIEGHE